MGASPVFPKPGKTFNTPEGKPASAANSANLIVERGVCSAGFTITSDEDGKTAFINFSGGSTALKAAHEAVPKRVQQAIKALKAASK